MAVKALLHYALEVPDQGAGKKFYSNFGLLNAPSRDATVRLRPAPLQREAVLLYGGPRRRRLGHVLLFTGGLDRQLDFYTRVLGMKLTDRSRQVIVFLRCTTDHHNLAFLVSKGPGFHHGSFEVGNVDEIAMGAAKMQESGWQRGWGLGRHVIGSNFFYYIRDPWGSFAEYFHDLDYIPEHCAWEPRDFPEAEALYRWGPPVPEDFGLNRELLT